MMSLHCRHIADQGGAGRQKTFKNHNWLHSKLVFENQYANC